MPAPIERTLILFKPDAVQRRLCGRILQRFEDKGLRIVGMKLMKISSDLAAKHYEAHKSKGFYAGLVKFMTSAPVTALVLEGPYAIDVCRKLVGETFGFKATPGTIRGDFGISNQFNLIHGSDSPEAAEREVKLFFPSANELLEYHTSDAAMHACD
jgi:nucleoside-diphosphate kinase